MDIALTVANALFEARFLLPVVSTILIFCQTIHCDSWRWHGKFFKYVVPVKTHLTVWNALCFSDYITIIQLFACHYNKFADSVFYFILLYGTMGRVSSVGIADRYGLDGPSIESRLGGGQIFCTCSDRPWGPPSLLYNGYRVFPGGKASGVWRWSPTPYLVTRLRKE